MLYKFRQHNPNYIGFVTAKNAEELFWEVDGLGFDPFQLEFKKCSQFGICIKISDDVDLECELSESSFPFHFTGKDGWEKIKRTSTRIEVDGKIVRNNIFSLESF
jgi:hypothetical protein